jgi:hypothetical protein
LEEPRRTTKGVDPAMEKPMMWGRGRIRCCSSRGRGRFLRWRAPRRRQRGRSGVSVALEDDNSGGYGWRWETIGRARMQDGEEGDCRG